MYSVRKLRGAFQYIHTQNNTLVLQSSVFSSNMSSTTAGKVIHCEGMNRNNLVTHQYHLLLYLSCSFFMVYLYCVVLFYGFVKDNLSYFISFINICFF